MKKPAREKRSDQGARFKILLLDAGLSPEQAAQMLHVTPRTIRYWISGTVTVPYAAFRLLRVMRLFELPCAGWDGWHMHSGKLWTPEGYGFDPHDSNWWGLLVRKATLFTQLYNQHLNPKQGFAPPMRPDRPYLAAGREPTATPKPTATVAPTDAVSRAA